MKRTSDRLSVLAVDIRSSRIGYAFFEGEKLLDWGSSRLKWTEDNNVLYHRLASMIRLASPSVLAVRRRSGISTEAQVGIANVVHAIQLLGTGVEMYVAYLDEVEIKESARFAPVSGMYDVACKIVSMFEELRSKLPPRRKIWRTEYRAMLIFDAVAVGLAFLWNDSHKSK